MQRQRIYAVKSVEQGVRRMLQTHDSPVALLAGRETLFFNSKRFGMFTLFKRYINLISGDLIFQLFH